MNAEATRHQNWIKVEPGDGAIKRGDRYRVEFVSGDAAEFTASKDWSAEYFSTSLPYYVWPRPEPKPWEAIPEGVENAAVMAVGVDGDEPVVGTYFRDYDDVWATFPGGGGFSYFTCSIERVTSAVPVTVVPTPDKENS